ncbi:MAG: L,D-transpeptidase family protein [Syntrophobacteraceae bacterium]
MKKRETTKLRPLPILLLSVIIGCSPGYAQPLAYVKDSAPLQEGASPPALPEEVDITAKSPLWQFFLLEAIPANRQSDPSKQIIMDAYQKCEWKPFFIDARFEIQNDAHILLTTVEKAQVDDAIAPMSYQLSSLHKNIKKLDELRASLRKADPKFRDTGLSLGESPLYKNRDDSLPQSQTDRYASVSLQFRLPDSDLNRSEKDRKYIEIFRAAAATDIELMNLLARYTSEMNPFCKKELEDALTGAMPFTEYLSGLELVSPYYGGLRKAYARYMQLAAQFPRPQIVGGATLRMGESGNEIRQLQKRLQQEDFYDGKITGTFDSATQEAVRKFQRAHLIDADGAVGRKTRGWLNVTYEQKSKIIAHSMRAMRQSQTRRHDTFIRINIPRFTLEYFRDGKVQNVHRVIVGKSSGKKVKLQGRVMGENHTPPISSSIEQVVVNPRWYLSKRIFAELSDTIEADPNYFSKHGYVRTASMQGQPLIFQLPGPTNPLGQIKFEFPNAYAVFLHDTPNKYLFNRTRRDFSHGCIRVEGARQLAQSIFADDQNPAAVKIDSYLGKNSPTYIRLNQPLPIIVEYVTAITDENGHIVFSDDIYGCFKPESETKS